MKYYLLILLSLFFGSVHAQNPNVTQIRQQMANIRQSTDWNNPEAAKKANEKIKELSKQSMMNNFQVNQPAAQQATNQHKEENEEGAEYRMKLWEQIWESAKAGEGADYDLAKPLREEIVKNYKEDESQQVLNQQFLDEMTLLVIDMSSPAVEVVIDQMENYKSIRTLVITGGENGAPVNLNHLLSKASTYPLESLYIINFKHFVKSIPESIARFNNLKELGLFNNELENLPTGVGALTSLKNFYADINPIKTLFPVINSLTGLDTLGIARTNINTSELNRINQLIPTCTILTK
jgi:hypothetical protein